MQTYSCCSQPYNCPPWVVPQHGRALPATSNSVQWPCGLLYCFSNCNVMLSGHNQLCQFGFMMYSNFLQLGTRAFKESPFNLGRNARSSAKEYLTYGLPGDMVESESWFRLPKPRNRVCIFLPHTSGIPLLRNLCAAYWSCPDQNLSQKNSSQFTSTATNRVRPSRLQTCIRVIL
jgi:hypothetical protein